MPHGSRQYRGSNVCFHNCEVQGCIQTCTLADLMMRAGSCQPARKAYMHSVHTKKQPSKNKHNRTSTQTLTQTESQCRDQRVARTSARISINLSRKSGMSKFDGCANFVTLGWIFVTTKVLEWLTVRCWSVTCERRDDGHLLANVVQGLGLT